MTGSSAAGPVRLFLREPPHLPFIQGWPGVPPNDQRQPATVQGAVEVRVNSAAVKAKHVRVEIRKYESVPSGPVAKAAFQNSWENVGKVHVLWRAPEGKEYDLLSTADFRFVIPLPVDMPPSIELSKISGIRYELVATVTYKGKGGFFRKDPTTTTTISQPLRIVKYDLASAWPMYSRHEQFSATGALDQLRLEVDRTTQAFGPGDRMLVTATVKSKMSPPFKVKHIELILTEVLTIMPASEDKGGKTKSKKSKNKAPQQPSVKRTQLTSARAQVGEFLGPGQETKGSLDLVVPTDRPLLTVRAKDFRLEYELAVEATLETIPNKLVVAGIPCIIGTFSRSSAQQAVKDIGFVEGFGFGPRPSATPQQSHSSATFPTGGSDKVALEKAAVAALAANRRSPSLNNGSFLSPDLNSVTNQSMHFPGLTPSPGSQQMASSPPGSPGRQIEGFTPRNDWRGSSSTTVTTATTLTTGTDFFHDRGSAAMTMPARRTSQSPNINGTANVSPDPGSRGRFDDNQMGGSMRHRVSSQSDASQPRATANSFGAWNSGAYESIVDTETVQSPGTGNSRASRDASAPLTTEPERIRAHHPSQSPKLPDIADESHHGLPPEYAPPSKQGRATSPPAGPSSSAGRQRNVSNDFMNASQEKDEQRRRYEEATRTMNPVVLGTSNPSSPRANGSDSVSPQATGTASGSGFAATAERHVGSPVGTSSDRATPAPSHPDDPIPYDQIFGVNPPAKQQQQQQQHPIQVQRQPSVNATPTPPPQPAKKGKSRVDLTAEEEKAVIVERYRNAQAAVARNQAEYDDDVEPDPEIMGPAPAPLAMLPAHINPAVAAMIKMPPNAAAGSSSQPPPQVFNQHDFASAEQEKEQMRKRYEMATGHETQSGAPQYAPRQGTQSPYNEPPRSQSSSAHDGPSMPSGRTGGSRSGSSAANYMSAADEKDAMRRRYEAAQHRVAHHQSPSPPSSPRGGGSRAAETTPSGSSHMPQAYLSAAEEKEMMRKRYEDAQNRVARASESPQANPGPATVDRNGSQSMGHNAPNAGGPLSYDEIFGSGGSRAGASSSSAPAGPSNPPAPNMNPAYMSAAQEKEMMRQRYENAQHAVARAAGEPAGPSAAGPSAGGSGDGPIPYDAIFGPQSSSSGPSKPATVPAAYMSAADEKEMMRKRYEDAQHRVARAAGSASPPPMQQQLTSSPTQMGGGEAAQGAYMSAEQEKDMMRRRYEMATDAVRHAQNTSPTPMGGSSRGGSMSSHARSATLDYGSPTGSVSRGDRSTLGRSMSVIPDGPPPPLAPRPPREYIERISARD